MSEQEAVAATERENILAVEKVGRLLAKYSIPAVISMLVNAIYNMVDQIFIGQGIGFLGVAATNVAFPVVTICTAAALCFGVGGSAGFNLNLGAGKKSEAAHIAGNTLFMLLVFGLVIGAGVIIFLEPVLRFCGATDAVMSYAKPYTLITAPGIPFMILGTGACRLIQQADGSPRYAMVCMLTGAVFNLAADPIFLFGLGMGIEGIALATTLGQVLTCVMAMTYIVKRFRTVQLKWEHLRPQAEVIKGFCALGLGPFFNQIAMMVAQIVLNNTLRHYGALSPYGADIPLAAVGAISKLNIIFFAAMIGIAQGGQPICSFNYGARRFERVKSALKLQLISGSVVAVLGFLTFQIFTQPLMAIFGGDDALYLEYAVRYLQIYSIVGFVNAFQPISSNFLTCIGKAQRGIVIGLTRQILFLLPLVIVLPLFLGINGVMYAVPISDLAAAAVSALLIGGEMRRMGKESVKLV